ncbi:MAG: hypothetical protein ACLVJ6_06680 [Merdibacter sp.]
MITVRTRSGDEYNASLVGSDEQSDLAVLRSMRRTDTGRAGDSTTLEVGDLAIAIGNPLRTGRIGHQRHHFRTGS